MAKVEIKLDTAGVGQLLKSDDVSGYCEQIGNQIKKKCSGSYEVDTQVGKYRAQTRVKTADKATYFRNLNNNELLKATGGKQ